ncbi:hypothetical protein [Reichenbachiella sp. MALMAid0571]|uniref:hypothetical protein n=1 Tax=Reichenbachiella sp. MALMAid0571 TaxID=3143939 RepID=UPI0032DF662C
MKRQIENSKSKLKDKVYETGYSPAGKRFIEISQQVSNRTTELIEKLSTNVAISTTDIDELIEMAKYEYDTIKFDSTFLRKSFENYSSLRTENFETSLLMFNLDVIENARELLSSYFFDVEYFIPVVLSDKFNIKKGETFKGTAILQAKMAAIKYLYEIKDPQTEEGYVQLPAWSTSNYDGIVRIKGTQVGTHKIKIRTTQRYDSGIERTFEEEFEITVTE